VSSARIEAHHFTNDDFINFINQNEQLAKILTPYFDNFKLTSITGEELMLYDDSDIDSFVLDCIGSAEVNEMAKRKIKFLCRSFQNRFKLATTTMDSLDDFINQNDDSKSSNCKEIYDDEANAPPLKKTKCAVMILKPSTVPLILMKQPIIDKPVLNINQETVQCFFEIKNMSSTNYVMFITDGADLYEWDRNIPIIYSNTNSICFNLKINLKSL
jgi:hypothetical protein